MFDFIEQIWETRYNFSNNRYCTTGGTFDAEQCPFTSEGLTKFNWGTMIIWIGYNFNDAELKWQMVNGTNLDFDYHYFGLKGSSAGQGAKYFYDSAGFSFLRIKYVGRDFETPK